jgi:signal transduction histidine kinase
LTGYGHDENVKNCYELGAYAFLAKPVHLVELKGLVRNAMLWEEYKRELKFHKEQLEELVAHRTRKLHQEIELRELTEQQLLRANKVKDKILSILTLDLRAPLSNIVTHLNFIHNNASAGLSAELETQISDLYDEAKSTWLLTENIFQWARCQKGEIVAHPEHYNLKAIINDTLLFYSTAISHKEIQVDMDIDEQLEIFSDRKIVYILIQNLLSNAVKYSEQGGVISISSRSLPETVEIMIQDFGAGISAESLDDIFDVTRPFSTLGTANEKGSGLGLVICQELAQIINAKISVESTVGKGTLVTLNLPVSKP